MDRRAGIRSRIGRTRPRSIVHGLRRRRVVLAKRRWRRTKATGWDMNELRHGIVWRLSVVWRWNRVVACVVAVRVMHRRWVPWRVIATTRAVDASLARRRDRDRSRHVVGRIRIERMILQCHISFASLNQHRYHLKGNRLLWRLYLKNRL